METNQIRIRCQECLSILDNQTTYETGIVKGGKFSYVKEIEVIRACLQNVVFWLDLLDKQHLNEPSDTTFG